MNTLKYKGYIGSVAYSEPDKVFFGKIEGIDGLVNYEGESVKELTAAFQEAVDDYLIFCEEHNCKPEKSYSGTFNVRIAPMAHREIANRANEAGISINAFVKQALDKVLKDPQTKRSAYDQPYFTESSVPAMLMEPTGPYGAAKDAPAKSMLCLRVPATDLAFARDLARRLGWELEEKG